MIKRIYFDLDECLAHTALTEPDQSHIKLDLEGDVDYFVMARPCARRVLDFARDLVGKENVYILTIALKDYALAINKLADWGFEDNQIFSREDIQDHSYSTGYGGKAICAHKLAHMDNVLIDNRPRNQNYEKLSFLGIDNRMTENSYLEIRDYYGVNFPDCPFEENIKKFLKDRQELPTLCKDSSEEDLEI